MQRKLYSYAEMRRVIDPAVVAVVGASETPGSFGRSTLANMSDFSGRLYAVNPKYRKVGDHTCFDTIQDLPEAPDCVIVCVSQEMIEPMMDDLAKMDAGGVIVFASGFSETGRPDRIQAQERLVAAAHRSNIRLIGPNSLGVTNTRLRAGMTFVSDYGRMGHRRGSVAVVSQSGGLGFTLLQGMQRGVGFSKFMAAGNSGDLDVCDYLSYCAEDDDTRAVVCLFEGVQDGARFMEAAWKLRDAGKALIVHKTGNGEGGRQAALSHTGTMVGSYEAYQAAFKAVGAVVADRLESVLELATFFAKSGRPRCGRGIGVFSTSGGATVIGADKAEEYGIALPPLADTTKAVFHREVAEFAFVGNPCDLTADAARKPETFARCLDAFLADPNVSAVVLMMTSVRMTSIDPRIAAISAAASRTDKPLSVVWLSEWYQGPGSEVFDADPRVSIFRSPDRCFNALRQWLDWHERKGRRVAHVRRASAGAAERARAIIARNVNQAGVLSESASKEIIAAYGIRIPAEVLVKDKEDAIRAATTLRFPVVVKIASADIPHKSDIGGVILDLNSEAEVSDAVQSVLAAAKRHMPDARVDGASIQEMLPAGVEIAVGIKRDPQFGAMVAVGLGGVMVELLNDTAVGMAPVSEIAARSMIHSLRACKVLSGYRGKSGVDVESLIDSICRLSELAGDLKSLVKEIDVNPLIVSADGAVAADALIVIEPDEKDVQ